MNQKNSLRLGLVLCLFFVSLGGFLLHTRIHSISAHGYNYIPFIAGLISVLILPVLFLIKKTVAYAYVLNGMMTLIGIITMTHFSIAHWPKVWDFSTIFLGTLFPDIMVCVGAFFIGKMIYELELTTAGNLDQKHRQGRVFRYPNLGFWCVHLVTLSVVYALGHFLWK